MFSLEAFVYVWMPLCVISVFTFSQLLQEKNLLEYVTFGTSESLGRPFLLWALKGGARGAYIFLLMVYSIENHSVLFIESTIILITAFQFIFSKFRQAKSKIVFKLFMTAYSFQQQGSFQI